MCNGKLCDGSCNGQYDSNVGLITQPHPRPFESAIQLNPKRAPMGTLLGPFPIGVSPAVNSIIINQMEVSQFCRSLVFINTSGSVLQIDNMKGWPIPPALNYVVRAHQTIRSIQVSVAVASATAGTLWVLTTEEELPPTIQFPITASIGANVGINSPIGAGLVAGAVTVTMATNQPAIAVSVGSVTITTSPQPQGAATGNAGTVVALLGASIPVLAARNGPTFRTGGMIRARKTNGGNATVNGLVMLPGDTLNFTSQQAFTCTANTNGDFLDVYEEWN